MIKTFMEVYACITILNNILHYFYRNSKRKIRKIKNISTICISLYVSLTTFYGIWNMDYLVYKEDASDIFYENTIILFAYSVHNMFYHAINNNVNNIIYYVSSMLITFDILYNQRIVYFYQYLHMMEVVTVFNCCTHIFSGKIKKTIQIIHFSSFLTFNIIGMLIIMYNLIYSYDIMQILIFTLIQIINYKKIKSTIKQMMINISHEMKNK